MIISPFFLYLTCAHPHNPILTVRHAKSGNYLGEAENRVHGFGIHSISSSQQNHVVLTAALDGSIALWDSSELGDFLQSFKANTDEVEEGSSRIQQSDLFPLKLIRSMTYAKQEKTESKAVTEIDGGSDLQNIPAIDSKSECLVRLCIVFSERLTLCPQHDRTILCPIASY